MEALGFAWTIADYDVTRKDSFQLPRIDATLDALNGVCWFSTLDLKIGYWQVELDPTAKEKTAFSFGKGFWQFTVMRFGCNAPATFERLMETAFAKNFDQHLDNLRQVFERLRRANLKLNPKKYNRFQTQVSYLRYIWDIDRSSESKINKVLAPTLEH